MKQFRIYAKEVPASTLLDLSNAHVRRVKYETLWLMPAKTKTNANPGAKMFVNTDSASTRMALITAYAIQVTYLLKTGSIVWVIDNFSNTVESNFGCSWLSFNITQIHDKVNVILPSTIRKNVSNHCLSNFRKWIVAAERTWERLGEMDAIFVPIVKKVLLDLDFYFSSSSVIHCI